MNTGTCMGVIGPNLNLPQSLGNTLSSFSNTCAKEYLETDARGARIYILSVC